MDIFDGVLEFVIGRKFSACDIFSADILGGQKFRAVFDGGSRGS